MGWISRKVLFEDVENHKCTKDEEKVLLNIFERVVKRMSSSLAKMSYYELEDFSIAKLKGCGVFTLEVTKIESFEGLVQYEGMFRHEDRFISVLVTVDKS